MTHTNRSQKSPTTPTPRHSTLAWVTGIVAVTGFVVAASLLAAMLVYGFHWNNTVLTAAAGAAIVAITAPIVERAFARTTHRATWRGRLLVYSIGIALVVVYFALRSLNSSPAVTIVAYGVGLAGFIVPPAYELRHSRLTPKEPQQ